MAELYVFCVYVQLTFLRVLLDFQVTNKLPNVTYDIGRTYAGNIGVQRPGHPNDTLFFIGVEKAKGSLTASPSPRNRDPWGLWLNGG